MSRNAMAFAALFLYVALLPFYLGDSGGLQWCDAALLPLAATLWWPNKTGLAPNPRTISLFRGGVLLLTLWTTAVNSLWFTAYGSSDFVVASASIVHGLLVICLVTDAWRLLGHEATMRVLGLGGLAGLILSALALPFCELTATGRATALFNNPNQLGYFALCACGLVCIARHQRALGWQHHLLGLCVAGLLILLSLSKAAMAGFAFLILFEFIRSPRIVCAGALIVLAGSLLLTLAPGRNPSHLVQRSDADDNMESRGYPRLWLQPEHLLLGAGDGRFERFPVAFGKHREMHSTFGNFLMSYGLLGTVLALVVVAAAIRGAPFLGLVSLCPIALYGLTHNGLRSRAAWLVLAAVACVSTAILAARKPDVPGQSATVPD